MLPDSVIAMQEVIERLSEYGGDYVDGVVLDNVDIGTVIGAVSNSKGLDIRYFNIARGGRVVEADGGIKVISEATVEERRFHKVRDLVVHPGGLGAFRFTATQTRESQWAGNYGPMRSLVETHFQFEIHNVHGYATYRVLRDPED